MSLPPPTHDSPRARLARFRHPGYSWCGRCGYPWASREGHSTPYGERRSMFPLCEECWTELGHPEARIPYYAALVDFWIADGADFGPEERRYLTNAVASGR